MTNINRFFIKLFVFCLPIAAFMTVVEMKLSRMPTSFTIKRDYIRAHAQDIEAIATGNSESFADIKPSSIASARMVNLANALQSLPIDSQLILKYIDELPRLRVIVVPVAFWSFDYHLGNVGANARRQLFYARHFNIPGDGNFFAYYNPRRLLLYTLYGPDPSLSYLRFGNSYEEKIIIEPDGWHRNPMNEQEHFDDATGKKRALVMENWVHLSNRPRVMFYLRKALQKAKDKNIRVVFVTLPMTKVCASKISPEYTDRMHAVVAELSSNYETSYKDYFQDNRFVDSDFHDEDHLNEQGAAKFSRILDEELLKKIQ